MRLIYSGKTKEFTPDLEEKVVGKLTKLGKLIEQRGEREAHVAHHLERHLHKICIEVKFYDHTMIGEGADADLDTALCHAIEKLETQIVKLRTKWRDTHRDPKGTRETKENWDSARSDGTGSNGTSAVKPAVLNGTNGRKPKVYRVDCNDGRKPMTVDEALIEIEGDSDDYVVYRDSGKNCLSVLVRRADGNFDLIESQ